eukprot:gene42319-58658_t
MVLAYAIGPVSGGHMNPAVSLCLGIRRQIPPLQAVAYVVMQLLGAMAGAAIVLGSLPDIEASIDGRVTTIATAKDVLKGTTNALARGAQMKGPLPTYWKVTDGNGLLAEVIGTFILCHTVMRTAVDKRAKGAGAQAPVAIGLSVFLAHCVLIPLTNCSINPARSFGASVVADKWDDHWLFWLGPALGSIFAAIVDFAFIRADPATQFDPPPTDQPCPSPASVDLRQMDAQRGMPPPPQAQQHAGY